MIVAGFGFRTSATCASLQSALHQAAAGHNITALAAPESKATANCLTALANRLGLPVHAVSADQLQTTDTATQSAHSFAHHQTGSVAEASALAAAGPHAILISSRHISEDRRATCAVAIRGPL